MTRHILMALALAGLAACGGGTTYSSQRGQIAAQTYTNQNYIAVTPGAVPVDAAGMGMVDPSSVVFTSAAPVTTAALTPGAAAEAAVVQPAVQVVPPAAPASAAQVVPVAAAVPAPPVISSTRGPIFSACRSSGRGEATAARCGCIQAVADSRLTAAQQKRGAGYFRDNHKLQEVRQSDRARDEQFWTAWKAFGEDAARQCR